MKRALAILLGCFGVACGSDEASGPTLHSVVPATAARAALVRVLGSEFGKAADGFVAVGGFAATVEKGAWNDAWIGFRVPAEAPTGQTRVVVTSHGVPSNPLDFVVAD